MHDDAWNRKDICHWCGKTYTRPIGDRKHRFCSAKCKQAHYRAYKSYVTGQARAQDLKSRSGTARK